MATSKKPRRVLSSRIAPSSRPRRLWILLVLSLVAVSYLVYKAARLGAVGGEGSARDDKRGVKYHREREEEGRTTFPPLPELVNRDRLWPPDLGESACLSVVGVRKMGWELRWS